MTEPFHIFVGFVAQASIIAGQSVGANDILCALLVYIVLLAISVVLQKLMMTAAEVYIPCIVAVMSLVMLSIRTGVTHVADNRMAMALIIPVVILMLLYLFKLKKVLQWVSAIYVYSIPIGLITSLVFLPFTRNGGTIAKVLYVTRYNNIDITGKFAGLAGIPEIVWGLFMAVIAALPVIFLATKRRKDER